jgi:hypothetical protein
VHRFELTCAAPVPMPGPGSDRGAGGVRDVAQVVRSGGVVAHHQVEVQRRVHVQHVRAEVTIDTSSWSLKRLLAAFPAGWPLAGLSAQGVRPRLYGHRRTTWWRRRPPGGAPARRGRWPACAGWPASGPRSACRPATACACTITSEVPALIRTRSSRSGLLLAQEGVDLLAHGGRGGIAGGVRRGDHARIAGGVGRGRREVLAASRAP